MNAFKVVPLGDGEALVVTGKPSGGRVQRLSADGKLTPVAGTGRLSAHKDGIRATRAGILPSDVAVLGSAILVAQAEPIPAIRRIDRNGKITTLVR